MQSEETNDEKTLLFKNDSSVMALSISIYPSSLFYVGPTQTIVATVSGLSPGTTAQQINLSFSAAFPSGAVYTQSVLNLTWSQGIVSFDSSGTIATVLVTITGPTPEVTNPLFVEQIAVNQLASTSVALNFGRDEGFHADSQSNGTNVWVWFAIAIAFTVIIVGIMVLIAYMVRAENKKHDIEDLEIPDSPKKGPFQ